MYTFLALFAVLVIAFALIAGRIEKTAISGPIVFTLVGLLLGRTGVGWIDVQIDGEVLRSLAELTLAVVLFTDAAHTDRKVVSAHRGIPIRLLLVGLPLTIALGYLVGSWLLPELSVWEVALLATMLAPTDAALGGAVISNLKVPARVRESLNVESGLNDGICVPLLFVFLGLASGQDAHGLAIHLIVEEIGVGLAVGVGLTGATVQIIRVAKQRGWFGESWNWVTLAALAMACFAVAQLAGGSGFIACFSGGILFSVLAEEVPAREELLETVEGLGSLLSLVTWVLFGAAVVGPVLTSFQPVVFLYAVLSLTIVRMLPVFLSLGGTTVSPRERLFMGWFGPRGLASVVFIVIATGELQDSHPVLTLTVATTVVLSIVAHGLTANPLGDRMGTAG